MQVNLSLVISKKPGGLLSPDLLDAERSSELA
jgi:hypothetical protein